MAGQAAVEARPVHMAGVEELVGVGTVAGYIAGWIQSVDIPVAEKQVRVGCVTGYSAGWVRSVQAAVQTADPVWSAHMAVDFAEYLHSVDNHGNVVGCAVAGCEAAD